MNINDIMLRDMAEAKKRAEIEEAEREARAYRRAEKFTYVCCALLWVLAVVTLALIAWVCVSNTAHKRRTAQLPNRELPITNCTVTIGSPLFEGATGDLDCGDKKLTFTNGVLHAVSDSTNQPTKRKGRQKMTRKDYIAGLEEIRKQVKQIGAAFHAVDLTDATGMESDRRKKTTKLVADLCDRLYEDIAISAKVAADKAEEGSGEQGDLFEEAEKPADDEKPTKKSGKGKKPGNKGGAK